MVVIDIEVVDDHNSSCYSIEYDNQNTLSQFILDLQSEGLAWPKGKPPYGVAIVVDDIIYLPWPSDFEAKTLDTLGFKSGSTVRIIVPVIGCGGPHPETPKIIFYTQEGYQGLLFNTLMETWHYWPENSTFGNIRTGDTDEFINALETVFQKHVDFNHVHVTLHLLLDDGLIHTVAKKQSLATIKDKTAIEFLDELGLCLSPITRWICIFTSRPPLPPPPAKRKRLGK